MQGPSNRSVVIISGLLTLLVLGGATLAVGFRNGWLQTGPGAAIGDGTALASPNDAERTRTLPPAREANPSSAPDAGAAQSEAVVYQEKLEEAYRALEDAYAQIRSLQGAQSQIAFRGDRDRAFTEHDDEDRRERGSRRRGSDDD